MDIIIAVIAVCCGVVVLGLGVIFGVFLFLKLIGELMPDWMKK